MSYAEDTKEVSNRVKQRSVQVIAIKIGGNDPINLRQLLVLIDGYGALPDLGLN